MSVLALWTVYDHPSDDPSVFVARRFHVTSDGPMRTEDTLRSPDVDDIRRQLADMGLVRLARSPEDDPVIVETWL